MRFFNLCLITKLAIDRSETVNRSLDAADPPQTTCNLFDSRALKAVRQRTAALGNGSFDVDSVSGRRKAGQPSVEGSIESSFFELRMDRQDAAHIERTGPCGAMAQQCGDSGYQSAPQKFIHLVGCRDSKVYPDPTRRPAAR
jgi:hypothetical protein